jgi:general secretion pathway protein D
VFREKDTQINKTELIIIITPHLMRSVNEARQVTDEFKRQLADYWVPTTPVRHMGHAIRRILE